MFGSPIRHKTDLPQAQRCISPSLAEIGEGVDLTLKKQRLDYSVEHKALKKCSLGYSAAQQAERDSAQMTPRAFKHRLVEAHKPDNFLKVNRGSTGRKRVGYLKASTESKKTLVSLFNPGPVRPVTNLEKDHNIDQVVRNPSPAFSPRMLRPQQLYKNSYRRDLSEGKAVRYE